MSSVRKRRIAVLGASGGIGRRIVALAVGRGFDVVCQTRAASKLADLSGSASVQAFDPRDPSKLPDFVRGADAVIFALGVGSSGATKLFSDVTAALIAAMDKEGVKRLIAVTGVGAGETRGHGGFVYDRIIFPLFTRKVYEDKDRQEALISASDLDWIIVRPAPFTKGHVTGAIEVHTIITPDTVLRSITRDEVAVFVVDQVEGNTYLRQRPFVGHR
jgi:putative NADH-flavin reductase